MRRIAMIAVVVAAIGLTGAAEALEYSADVVSTGEGNSIAGKIFVSNDKIRMEMAGNATITRMDKGVMWMLMPGQDMYMEQPFDPEKVAGTAEKMPGEIERTSLGPDTVDGKAAAKYRVVYTSKQGQATVLQWIEPSTGIPLKTAAEDGSWSMEYRNLTMGPPDASLFEVPPGYKKFAMPNMADVARAAEQAAAE